MWLRLEKHKNKLLGVGWDGQLPIFSPLSLPWQPFMYLLIQPANLHLVFILNQAFSITTSCDPAVPWFIIPSFTLKVSTHMVWSVASFFQVISLTLGSGRLSLSYHHSPALPSFRLIFKSNEALNFSPSCSLCRLIQKLSKTSLLRTWVQMVCVWGVMVVQLSR